MKKLIGVVVLAIALFAVVMGCSKGGGSNVVSNVVSNDNDLVTGVIGANGGTLTTPSGNTSLDVPVGALSGNIVISVSQNESSDTIGPPQIVYSFYPDGLTFNTPATVTFKYNPDYLPSGADETNLKVAYESNGQWIPVLESTVNTVNHSVSAPITHFSGNGVVYYDPLGAIEGDFNGVVVYSNNHSAPTPITNLYYSVDDPHYLYHEGPAHYENGYVTGEEWQCVEYVSRYYWLVYNYNVLLTPGLNDATNFWDTAIQRGLKTYLNEDTTLGGSKPNQGDIVVFEKKG